MTQQRVRSAMLLILASAAFVATIVGTVHAEIYTPAITPGRTQESNSPAVLLAINVTGATIGATYKFTWTVTDPSGVTKPAPAQTVATSSTLVLSVAYPADFGTNINFVGNYTVNVQQNNPTNKPSVATGQFQVGLTDSTTYQRTFPVSIKARGYGPSSNVTISITHGTTTYPQWQLADTSGTISHAWQIPASAPTGLYTVALSGTTAKTPADTQTFTVYPTNVTIAQLTITQPTFQRTLSADLRFTATYLSGTQSQTGSATVRITEADGITSHLVQAFYNSTLISFRALYKVPLSGQTGIWIASIDPARFDDGYGNAGPNASVARGFNVQPATLKVSVSVPSKTYGAGDVMPIYASINAPDGSIFNSGTAAVTLSFSSRQVGSAQGLTFVQGQAMWVGSYVVNSTDPSGVWLVDVKVSDSYGNTGEDTTSSVVSVPAPAPPVAPSQPFNTFYFLLGALIMGSGGTALLAIKKFNTTLKPFEEFFNLTGGELRPPLTLMVTGEPGAGTTLFGLEIIYRELTQGKRCGLITYDNFPSEIERMMRNMGSDVSSQLKDGRLKILDCYSALAGNEKASIRDPMDFTEISIQVTSMMEAGEGPTTILLDSVTSIFNSAQPRTAINFLRTLSAKVKNKGGILVLTGAKDCVPDEAKPNMETILDGLIELGLVRKAQSFTRTLTIKRLAGHKPSAIPIEFDIVPGRGIVFRKWRLPVFRPRSQPDDHEFAKR